METKPCQLPIINLNILVQNYTNVQTIQGKFPYSQQKFEHSPKTEPLVKESPKYSEIQCSKKRTLSPSSLGASPISYGTPITQFISDSSTEVENNVYEEIESPGHADHIAEILGFFLVGLGALLFILVFYSLFISPFVGKTGHTILDFIRKDYYYTMLIPLIIPTTLLIVYANWLSIKFFRHSY